MQKMSIVFGHFLPSRKLGLAYDIIFITIPNTNSQEKQWTQMAQKNRYSSRWH